MRFFIYYSVYYQNQFAGAGMFEGVKKLEQLSLRNNGIRSISSDSFKPVPALTTLDLAKNQLQV